MGCRRSKFADINWQLNPVQSSSYPHTISNLFINTLDSGGFSQMVDSPTRNANVLDLFATNRPSFVLCTKLLPGISDHEIVFVESMLTTLIVKSSGQDILLWNKADYQRIEQIISEFFETFYRDFTIDTPVQYLWDAFKSLCYQCLSSIPHKTISNSSKPPWITRHIKRLSNKKQRVYNQAQLSGSDVDWANITNLKEQSRKSVGSPIINMFQNCLILIIIMVINVFGYA